jgi:hypothetical protein
MPVQDFGLSLVIGSIFAIGSVALVLAIYFVTRRVLSPGSEADRTHDAASSVAFRIAALYGLILALVYAQELEDYKGIRSDLTEEAVAIADVYNDIQRYGGAEVAVIRADLALYLFAVVNEEWHLLGRKEGLSGKAWRQWEDVYLRLLDLTPHTDREKYLANRMRDRVTAIARYRQIRESRAIGTFSGLFWGPALIGLALLAIPFYIYPPTRTNLLLLAAFGLYSGVVLLFIYMFANPFEAPGRLQPTPFLHLLAGDIGKTVLPEAAVGP